MSGPVWNYITVKKKNIKNNVEYAALIIAHKDHSEYFVYATFEEAKQAQDDHWIKSGQDRRHYDPTMVRRIMFTENIEKTKMKVLKNENN